MCVCVCVCDVYTCRACVLRAWNACACTAWVPRVLFACVADADGGVVCICMREVRVRVCACGRGLHVCMWGLCMGGGSGNRGTDREFLRMINGLWKEAPHPSDTLAGSALGIPPTFWLDQPR